MSRLFVEGNVPLVTTQDEERRSRGSTVYLIGDVLERRRNSRMLMRSVHFDRYQSINQDLLDLNFCRDVMGVGCSLRSATIARLKPSKYHPAGDLGFHYIPLHCTMLRPVKTRHTIPRMAELYSVLYCPGRRKPRSNEENLSI